MIEIGVYFGRPQKKGKKETVPPGLQKYFWVLVASHHSEPPDKIVVQNVFLVAWWLVARLLGDWLLGCVWQGGWGGSIGGWEKRKEAGVASLNLHKLVCLLIFIQVLWFSSKRAYFQKHFF